MTETSAAIASLPQPFGFYRVLTGQDFLHFGYWPDGKADLPLAEAQEAHLQLLLERLPTAPAKVLDVGCGLGVTAGRLSQLGYTVVAIAPSEALIAFANQHYPGPTFIACPFEADNAGLERDAPYDAILLQESLQYLANLDATFTKLRRLLSSKGRLLVCDEVSYDEETRQQSSVHLARDIEVAIAENGFAVRCCLDMGRGVTPTTRIAVDLFEQKKQHLLARFGETNRPEIEQFTEGWRQQAVWYGSGQFGYSLWVLSPADCRIRKFNPGDEKKILKAFSSVFHQTRSLAHWRWKFTNNPYGHHRISNAWSGDKIAAHYAGYPVPVWLGDRQETAQHVGDTLTVPEFRGIGQGRSSLLARTAEHFFACHCKGHVAFCFGFNTDRIQKIGRLFMGYQPVKPVVEWKLSGTNLARVIKPSLPDYLFPRCKVTVGSEAGDWADALFLRAKKNYPWLLQRDKAYLTWRYQNHPDFDYRFFVASANGREIAWCAGYMENETFLLVDALFDGAQTRAFRAILKAVSGWAGQTGRSLKHIQGWFSEGPDWCVKQLEAAGFEPRRQHQALELCVRSFSAAISEQQIGENFYFTMGDSDLF